MLTILCVLIWIITGAGIFALVGRYYGEIRLSELIVGAIAGPVMIIFVLIFCSQNITIWRRKE